MRSIDPGETVAPWQEEDTAEPALPLGSRVPLDVYETAGSLVVLAALPGASAENVEVTATAETVTLRGAIPSDIERPEAGRRTWYLREVPAGAFARTIDLPVEIDPRHATATFANGLLRLDLPKAEKESEVRSQESEGAGPLLTPDS